MSKDTIEKLLDRLACVSGKHAELHDKVEEYGVDCPADFKKQKLQKKDDIEALKARLGEFPHAELRAHLDDVRRRLNIASSGGRSGTSSQMRERFEADIELLESLLPTVYLAHDQESGTPPASVALDELPVRTAAHG